MTADPTTPEEKLTDELLQLTERELDNAQRAADAYAEEPRIGASWFIVKRLIAEVRRSRTLQQQGMGWEERARAFCAKHKTFGWYHLAREFVAIHQEATERAAKIVDGIAKGIAAGAPDQTELRKKLIEASIIALEEAAKAIRVTGEKA